MSPYPYFSIGGVSRHLDQDLDDSQCETQILKMRSLDQPDLRLNHLPMYERLFAAFTTLIFVFDLNTESSRIGPPDGFQRCWPHFPGCHQFPLPAGFPEYTNSAVFAGVFALIVFTLWNILNDRPQRWLWSLGLLVFLKFFYQFVWHFSGDHNFEYFHLLPAAAFLLNKKDRLWAVQVTWVVLLSFTALVKVSEAWITGSYFSSLIGGAPLVPDSAIPLVTNAVIWFEIWGSWALLHPRFRTPAFWGWLAFHVYSVILVGFFYPFRCVGVLLLLFRPGMRVQRGPLNRPTVAMLAGFALLQVIPHLYPEDHRQTLRFEGYMFNMIEANYQCAVRIKPLDYPEWSFGFPASRRRCGGFEFLQRAKHFCRMTQKPVSLQVDQSLDGNPFYRIVDLADACAVQPSLFGSNPWLIAPGSTSPTGYPRANSISAFHTQDASAIMAAEPTIKPSPLQNFLRDNLNIARIFYYVLWLTAVAVGLRTLIRLQKNK